MDAPLLKFPETGGRKVQRLQEAQVHTEHLSVEAAKELLPLVRDRLAKSEGYIRRLSLRRKEIRKKGLESLIIELSAIVEGNKVQAVRDALEEAIEKNRGVEITQAALDRVHRMDMLVAEASELLLPLPEELPAPVSRPLPLLSGSGARPSDTLTYVLGATLVLVLVGTVTYAVLRDGGRA